jgi:hypothetical protein
MPMARFGVSFTQAQSTSLKSHGMTTLSSIGFWPGVGKSGRMCKRVESKIKEDRKTGRQENRKIQKERRERKSRRKTDEEIR